MIMNQFSAFTGQQQIDNEIRFSNTAFEKWRQFIYDDCGIYFQDNKKYLLESRLLRRIRFLGLKSFDEYLDYIKYDKARASLGNNEKKYLYAAITINETFFFRNPHQLDAMVTTILPEIIEAKRSAGKNKIRIWSAASSSGEEAYSIAISITEAIKPKYPDMEFEIIGTDISHAALETAQSGVFNFYSVRNMPAYYMKKYFKAEGGNFIIDPKIKQMVNFKFLNLYDNFNMKLMFNFDIIFCANVLIYFDPKSKIKVVNQLFNALNRGGYLFIGYSESLHNISKEFEIVSFPKTIGYKKD